MKTTCWKRFLCAFITTYFVDHNWITWIINFLSRFNLVGLQAFRNLHEINCFIRSSKNVQVVNGSWLNTFWAEKIYADATIFFVKFFLPCSVPKTKSWERRSIEKIENQSIKIRRTIPNCFLIFPANMRRKF